MVKTDKHVHTEECKQTHTEFKRKKDILLICPLTMCIHQVHSHTNKNVWFVHTCLHTTDLHILNMTYMAAYILIVTEETPPIAYCSSDH